MNNDEFLIEIIAKLQQTKSKKQINADIRQLEKAINMLRLTGTLAKGDTKREINQYIRDLGAKLNYVKLNGKIDDKNLKREINKSLHNLTFKDIDALNIDVNKTKLKLQKVIADLKTYAERNSISVNVGLKKEKLGNDLTAFLNKNTKIRESSVLLKESERIRELIDSVNDKKTLKNATDAFRLYKSEVAATGFATTSTTDKIKNMLGHITKIGSAFGVASLVVNNFVKSLKTLKSNDTILTEISKTSELTKRQLKELGDEAFKTASKYGQLSSNYLLGVQEMAKSGYEDLSKELAEVSLLAQSAGNMTAESANNYLIATDAAYKYSGSVEKLSAALDGANYISNRNSASLTDIADATRVSASFAANAGVAIDELTAAESAMIATTKRSGSEIGRAFRSIVLNLQQVSGEFDGEIIDEEQLKKVEARCHSLGVELEYIKNGVATLRNPMEVLKDLARVYNSLPDNSADKQGLISDLGGKYHANALSSLLGRWDLYEKMLIEFSQGTGSALEEAEKTANSWEGRLNSLQNSFDSFFNTLTNKEAIKGGISFFDRMIQGAEALTDAVGEIPVMLTAVNSAMVATNKDYGITQVWNKDKGKIDVQGNIFGIDFTAIKNMKMHFSEAEGAIAGWNRKLLQGQVDINKFNNSVVKNNVQLKDYLSTCSKDTTASLEGYKSYLKAAGVNTDALRWKTILLNSAITMLGGWVIQAMITGFYELLQVSSKAAESAKELGNSFNDTRSGIEDYKSQIEELYKTINDSNSSIEDVTNARKNLMSVQDKLIDKFGTEKGVIDDVTDAINGQTEALDRLTQTKWQEVKNNFNDGGFWNGVSNFLGGYSDNIDRMLDEYEDYHARIRLYDFINKDNLEQLDAFKSLLENKFDAEITFDASEQSEIAILSGNANEIYENLLDIQSLAEQFHFNDSFENKLTKLANSAQKTSDQYKDFYNQYILYEKILSKDSNYADTFKDITDAYDEYQEAFTSGDEDKIKEATEKYAKVLTDATANTIANGDSDVATYFENMYPALQSVVKGWQFNVAFDANTDNLQNEVQSILDELKDEDDRFLTAKKILGLDETKDGRSLTAEEILGLDATNEQYQTLVSIAHAYNMSLEEMIELLKERNLVSAMDYQGLVGLFGQENVDKLSLEDLEIAYQIKNIGNMTFEELQTEIEKAKEVANEPISLSISKTIDQLNTRLKPAMDSLKSAWKDIFTDDEADLNSIDILSTCDSIKSKLDELNNINGVTVDYSSYEDFVRVLRNSESTTNDVKEAFNSLATSITQAALSGAEDFETMKAALEDLGVVNSEMVAFDALISNTEALKDAGIDLASVTNERLLEFANESVVAENAAQAYDMLRFHKELCNMQEMNTSNEVANLRTLAENAGYTGSIIQYLTELEQIYQELASGTTNPIVIGVKLARAAQLQALIQNAAVKINYTPEVDFSGIEKATKKAETDFTDLLDKELTVLDKKIEAGYIDFKDYIQARLTLIEDYYNQGKIKADEYYFYLEKHYKQELSYRDKVIKAVTRRIDKEIDSLEKQKDAIKDSYKLQIDALEKEKTLLEDANKERQRQIDLQKALYELERARNQRTKLIYSEDKGMHYVADSKSIRDAENEAENARHEIQISEIEKSITLLEKSRDAETDVIDDMIDKLQEYKEAWNDITSAYEEEQEDLIAAQMLGQEWENDILDARLDKLNQFKDDYIAIQQAMVDAAYQAAQAMANAENAIIGDSSQGKTSGGYEVVDESDPTNSKKSIPFNTKQEADAYAETMNHNKASANNMEDDQFNNSDIPGYYVKKKFHTGLKQGLVDTHSFDDDFKLVQKVGLGEKEIPAILKEGEAVATPAQISNIADGLRAVDDIPAERPFFAVEQEKWERCAEALGRSIDDMLFPMGIQPNNIREMTNMGKLNHVSNINNIRQNQPITMSNNIHVTCPGVTEQQVAERLGSVIGKELDRQFNGFHNYTDQMSRIR